MKFKDIPDNEKPRERLFLYGSDKLSNEELLCIILKTGTKKYSVKEVASNLLSKIGNVKNLKDIGVNTLMDIEGIGKVKAIELRAIIELGMRIYKLEDINSLVYFTSAIDIYKYFVSIYKEIYQEEFYCVYLDNKKKYLDRKKLFIGSINKSIVHPREIFKNAYLLSASYIICLHNHPGGDPSPSHEDIDLTMKLYEIGIIHSIPLLDHIIIGKDNYFSFYENGYFKNR